MRARFSLGLLALSTLLPLATLARPNVLFIISDDLNNYVGYLGGHPQALTPHLDSLAATGAAFPRAYANNPICAPSRASLFTGIQPHVSRNFFWEPWYENGLLASSRTLMEQFHRDGYAVAGTGKLMHHSKDGIWPEFGPKANAGPYAWNGKTAVGHPSVPEPFRSAGPVDGGMGPLSDIPYEGLAGKGWSLSTNRFARFHYGDENDRDPLPDETYAEWAAQRLHQHAAALASDPNTPPLFLGVGFIRPHTPLYVPDAYFQKFPLESVQLPVILDSDTTDIFYNGIIPPEAKGLHYFQGLGAAYGSTEMGLKRYVQAYLACVAFLDDQVGKLLQALETSGLADNTIVIVTSDHGYMMGEKEYLFKDAPWEQCTQVPLLIRAPGVSIPGSRPAAPVSLIDLYPTLVDLCDLDKETRKSGSGAPLDGHSLRPLLVNPDTADWGGPDTALTLIHAVDTPASPLPADAERNVHAMHYSLRSRDHRYIRYNNGSEELYDHRSDPREWINLAGDPDAGEILLGFRERLNAILPNGPWQDPADLISIRFIATPPPFPATESFESFGVEAFGTVVGHWNNVQSRAGGLLRGNGESAPLALQARLSTLGNATGVGEVTLSKLRSTFPDGYWGLLFFEDSNRGDPFPGNRYSLLGRPEAPLVSDTLTYTAPAGRSLRALQLIRAEADGTRWHDYRITDTGYVDTGTGFLSWLWVGPEGNGIADWKYAVRLRQWVYAPYTYLRPGWGVWVYLSDAGAFNADELTGNWFKSLVLDTWVLSFAPEVTEGPGWVYITDMSQ